jgi:ribonucleoside-diphosphate reductase alpha chain
LRLAAWKFWVLSLGVSLFLENVMADISASVAAQAHTQASNPAAADPAASGQKSAGRRKAPGLAFRRLYTQAGVSPYECVQWEMRDAQITDALGNVIFEQKSVEVPKQWSQTATNIVASKYLHGTLGAAERENGARHLITRVAETIRDWGAAGGYFRTADDAAVFHDELVHLLLHQMAAFNSPVWFNVGCDRLEPRSNAHNWHWNPASRQAEFGRTGYSRPQCSACFINSVQDSLDSILTLVKTEGMLFKWGSGTGTNLSAIRGSMENLSGGGQASGPLSFMRGFDAFAGVIKSGGKTRRAAKMVILNIDHPDIAEFIDCKAKEEAKAWVLAQNGYDGSTPDSEAYSSVFFQNANNSVRVTDEFMAAVENDAPFSTRAVRDGHVMQTYRAQDLLRRIAVATWQCGDPGMQFDTTVNRWHTSRNSGRINASNPCSEYMFLDDSACNLASLNLAKFAANGAFDVESFRHAVDIMITAQEILVDASGYPTEAIARNSHDFRPLGLGYSNLGALLMSGGMPYDSDTGRDYAAAITAILCGEAYLQSARLAELCPRLEPASATLAADSRLAASDRGGACPGFYLNREPFLDTIRMHRASVNQIGASPQASSSGQISELKKAAEQAWDAALAHGGQTGFRNSQVTVLAPTGTIGFMMDCDTTGIEPELGLVKYKKLVGGGMIKIVNNTVSTALFKLGYSTEQAGDIVSYIDATGTIEGAPHVREEHLPVFDCSFKPAKGTRSIAYLGHLRMMAAVQPFISGAISKTVNLPENATVEDIMDAYIAAWRLGLKSVAMYRDGCKKAQPLVLSMEVKEKALAKSQKPEAEPAIEEDDLDAPPRSVRHKLPAERFSITHKFHIAGHEGYITVGCYRNGQPGEIFITMAKEGSTVSGLMDSFALAISMALQHGVPLKLLCEKFEHTRFEPSGWTQNPDIGYAKSIMDYLFRWLHLRFLSGQQQTLFDDLRPRSPLAVTSPPVNGTLEPTTPPFPTLTPPHEMGGPAEKRKGKAETPHHAADALKDLIDLGDAPSCQYCGSIMLRNGSCYKCLSCGSTSGCS